MTIYTGTNFDDHLKGGSGADVMNGGAGDDFLQGKAGADIIDGGQGNDTIHGDGGDDTISGGARATISSMAAPAPTPRSIRARSSNIASPATARISSSIIPAEAGSTATTGCSTSSGCSFSQRRHRPHPEQRADRVQADSASTNEDVGTYSSGSTSVLSNDFDWEGDSLTATPGTFNGVYGTLVLNANGTYTYTPFASTQSLALRARSCRTVSPIPSPTAA